MRNRKRLPAALLGAVLIAGLVPGVALAAPANDDFTAATEITALPFRTTVDTTGATRATDDPWACGTRGDSSVWLRYTAPTAGIVRLSVRSNGKTPVFAVYTGARGALTALPGTSTCGNPTPFEDTFHAEAGTTYHVMVFHHSASEAGPVQVGLTTMSPEANDNRASARVTGLPARLEGDLRRSTAEPDEAPPSCAQEAVRSVWYRYTATKTRFVSLITDRTTITVHRQNDMAEVECSATYEDDGVFRAVQGETYLIRVADRPQQAERFMLDIGTAHRISVHISTWPGGQQPAGTEIAFDLTLVDPHDKNLVSGTITFGDGSSMPFVRGERIVHRYALAGVYDVTVTASTRDGRTGTGSTKVVIK